MINYQEVVDELRSFLDAKDQTYSDQLKATAAQYAEACQQVNQRLRRCEEFLNKGLRSEAIHLAQTDPALLDLVAILDFPGRASWEEAAALYGLATPPRLNIETA